MTRLKKELIQREIIFDHDGCGEVYYHQYRPEYDDCQKLVGVTDQFIICVYYSAVLDPELRLYDRYTFKLIAGQLLRPDKCMSLRSFARSAGWELTASRRISASGFR